jgi:hypothetical protein
MQPVVRMSKVFHYQECLATQRGTHSPETHVDEVSCHHTRTVGVRLRKIADDQLICDSLALE